MKRKKTIPLSHIWKKSISNWKTKYRLVIKNDSTHHVKLTFLLSPKNIFVVVITSAVILVMLTAMLIAFTPLRVYVPGYTTPDEYREYKKLALRIDSVDILLKQNQQFIDNVYLVLSDQIKAEEKQKEAVEERETVEKEDYKKSDAAILMEEEAERIAQQYGNERINASTMPLTKRADIETFFPFPPAKGVIVNNYSVANKHFGIDIRNEKNSLIYSIDKGIVIFSGYDVQNGNTIIIQHEGNIISKYQHNNRLIKKVGEKVQKGEIIATMGSSGNAEAGNHLHFELWYNGFPINPLEYITIDL